jgi:5-aminopentanamidase
MASLRIAAFQRQPYFDDVRGTIKRLLADLAWCDDQGIQLAVFPECFLQGYEGYNRDRALLVRRAIAFDDGDFAEMLAALSSIQTTTVLGVIERRNAKLYNTAAVIQDGKLLGRYSKTHPNEKAFQAGDDYPVFDLAGWLFGINICNDGNFPEAARQLSLQGARLLCYPLNNMLEPHTAQEWRCRHVEILRLRASENRCWLVSSDVVGSHGTQISYGCTCVIDPHGNVVERVPEETEGRIVCDLAGI